MNRVEGSAGVRLLECTNPVKDKWRIRWDVQVRDDGSASYMEEEFTHKPSAEEIRAVIVTWINSETDRKILSGFVWDDISVWLSTENQLNYASIERMGAEYPLTLKLGEDGSGRPLYHTFHDVEEFSEFSNAASLWVMRCVQEGWGKKDGINLTGYV